MPLYDITCAHCEGIFEKILPVGALHAQTDCPYCGKGTAAVPALNGSHIGLRVLETWRPRTRAEQLAGEQAGGPGTHAGAGRSSVLHNCKGFNCSICGT